MVQVDYMHDEPSQCRSVALRRLTQGWIDSPIFFLTVCVQARRHLLAHEAVHSILREVWQIGYQRHGWQVGRYVIMPDHVHLFCAASRQAASLGTYVGAWKQWSSKLLRGGIGMTDFQWQRNFFDHVLRSQESYQGKWHYVMNNPVRAGLVRDAAEWLYAGHLHFL